MPFPRVSGLYEMQTGIYADLIVMVFVKYLSSVFKSTEENRKLDYVLSTNDGTLSNEGNYFLQPNL